MKVKTKDLGVVVDCWMVSNCWSSGQRVGVFLSTVKQSGGSWNYSYRQPMCGHHPLHFAHLYRSKSGAKVTDAANNEGELSVENILVSLYQDMRKEKR